MKKLFRKIKHLIRAHPKASEWTFLILIFLISLAIRRIGLKHGFPLLTHPDEGDVINPVLHMTREHTLNPGEFAHPDQILHYLNLIYLNLLSFILFGENVASAYSGYYLNFYFYSRFLVSVMGSLIPIVAYKIGKEFNPKLSVTSALVFAFFPVYTKYSLFITPDVPITLFTLLVIYFAIRYFKTNIEKYIVLATIFSAVNTAEKFPGLVSLAIVIITVGFQILSNKDDPTPQKIRFFFIRSAKLSLIFLITLFIVAPFLFLDYQSVLAAIKYEAKPYHLGGDNLGFCGNLCFYVQTIYLYVGVPGIFLFLVGSFTFIKRFSKQSILLLYGFFYWVILSMLALHWERWALPMYIAPLFIIVFGISFLLEKKEKNSVAINVISALLISFFLIQQSIYTLYIPIQKKFTDTRVVSTEYCDLIGINRDNSIYEGYTPLQPNFPTKIFDDFYEKVPNKDFVLLSSIMYNRYFAEPERYQDSIDIYNEIRDSYPLIKQYIPSPYEEGTLGQLENILYFIKYRLGLTDEVRYSGPTIEIYQISE